MPWGCPGCPGVCPGNALGDALVDALGMPWGYPNTNPRKLQSGSAVHFFALFCGTVPDPLLNPRAQSVTI